MRRDGPQVFRREGEYWTIVYAGTTVRLRDAIGLQYLAYLVAHPHQRLLVEQKFALRTGSRVCCRAGYDKATAKLLGTLDVKSHDHKDFDLSHTNTAHVAARSSSLYFKI
jgi:hypothetical protein